MARHSDRDETQVRRKTDGWPGSARKGKCIEEKLPTRNSAQQKGQAEALTQRAPPQAVRAHTIHAIWAHELQAVRAHTIQTQRDG